MKKAIFISLCCLFTTFLFSQQDIIKELLNSYNYNYISDNDYTKKAETQEQIYCTLFNSKEYEKALMAYDYFALLPIYSAQVLVNPCEISVKKNDLSSWNYLLTKRPELSIISSKRPEFDSDPISPLSLAVKTNGIDFVNIAIEKNINLNKPGITEHSEYIGGWPRSLLTISKSSEMDSLLLKNNVKEIIELVNPENGKVKAQKIDVYEKPDKNSRIINFCIKDEVVKITKCTSKAYFKSNRFLYNSIKKGWIAEDDDSVEFITLWP